MSDTDFGLESTLVMQAANHLLRKAGLRQRLVKCTGGLERGFKYRSATGKTIIVTVREQFSVFTIIKSILQCVDEKRRCDWLINGQANTNTRELLFFGEQTVIQYSRKDALQFQYGLMSQYHDEAKAMELALERMTRMEEFENGPDFPDQTTLVTRDEHDHPHYQPFSEFAGLASPQSA